MILYDDNYSLPSYQTHVCVEQTAFDLMSEKIDVWLVADCCASRLNQDRDLALERLRHIGCTIASSESVIFNLLGDKNHKAFKQIAPWLRTLRPTWSCGGPRRCRQINDQINLTLIFDITWPSGQLMLDFLMQSHLTPFPA